VSHAKMNSSSAMHNREGGEQNTSLRFRNVDTNSSQVTPPLPSQINIACRNAVSAWKAYRVKKDLR